jgi:RNA polymerase sigma factor (sigma-70 family)
MDWPEICRRLEHDIEDEDAWTAIQTRVRPWARRELGDLGPDAVDDAVADTCARVYVAFDRRRGCDTFQGFVLGHFLGARRHLLRVYRRFDRLNQVPEPSYESSDGPDPYDAERLRQCRARLRETHPRRARAVELRYDADASDAQIAEALGVTKTNARQLVFHGLRHLRDCIWKMRQEAEVGGNAATLARIV